MELIFYGILVSFVSHLFVGITILSSSKNAPKYHFLSIGILILWCFSFIFLYGDWAGLHDVLHEYPQGLDVNSELNCLWVILLVHFAFYFFSLIYLIVIQAASHVDISQSVPGEKLFILLNSIGVVYGIIELIVVYLYFNVRRPLYKFEVIPFIIILIP